MVALSPQVGELLLQATQSSDLEEAFHKVLREYLELKLAVLDAEIGLLEKKWACILGTVFPETFRVPCARIGSVRLMAPLAEGMRR